MVTDRANLRYPRPIAGNWPGVHEAGFTSGYGIYAAVKWGQNREYLFQRNKYLPFDVGVDKVDDGYPLPIAGYWPGMAEAGFGNRIQLPRPRNLQDPHPSITAGESGVRGALTNIEASFSYISLLP
jgi:hypothetical protein